MQLVFILIAILGLLYFLFKKRNFDLIAFSYFCSIIYFTPGFFGYVKNPYSLSENDFIIDQTYIVFITILSLLILNGIISDHFVAKKKLFTTTLKMPKSFIKACLILSLVGFFMFYLLYGSIVFSFREYSKSEVLERIQGDRWHILWIYSASFGILHSIFRLKYYFILIFSGMFMLHILIGHRSNSVFVLLSLVLFYFSNNISSKVSLFSYIIKYKVLAFFLFVGGSFFYLIKAFLPFIKVGNYDLLINSIQNNDLILLAFLNSEPFVIQATLNQTLLTKVNSDPYSIIDIVSTVIPLSPVLGLDRIGNYLNQDAIFPGLNYGLANNMYASIWSSFGWLGLLIFVLLLNILMFSSNYLFLRFHGFSKFFLAYFFGVFFFYLHRNDFFTQLNLQKRVLIIFFICFLIGWLIDIMLPKKKKL